MRHVEEERPMQLTVLNTFPFVFWEMSASSPNLLRWCDLGLLLSDFLAELLVFGGPCGGVCQKHDPGVAALLSMGSNACSCCWIWR
jgi:hypothetical protein